MPAPRQIHLAPIAGIPAGKPGNTADVSPIVASSVEATQSYADAPLESSKSTPYHSNSRSSIGGINSATAPGGGAATAVGACSTAHSASCCSRPRPETSTASKSSVPASTGTGLNSSITPAHLAVPLINPRNVNPNVSDGKSASASASLKLKLPIWLRTSCHSTS